MVRFAFLLSLLLPAFAASADTLDLYAGRYLGCAVSGGELVPIETTLVATVDGLAGKYVFIESTGRRVAGAITPTDRQSADTVAVIWSDVYGEGPAVFTFADDGSRFDGYWMSGGGTDRFSWNGVRSGSGKRPPDCRVPVS